MLPITAEYYKNNAIKHTEKLIYFENKLGNTVF